ncbi:MAG: hypothetical protein EA427_00445 [Spirochaetaceae bacterium]|nr:MAG: hypothetical protein EA427_00445 [Spirochaetaceae bacterium]
MSANKPKEVTVELLYFDGCPSYRQAWNDILDVLVEEKIDASVRLISVESMDHAQEWFEGATWRYL